TVSQRHRVGELVRAEIELADHLRLDLAVGVRGEERVVDHVAVVPHDVGRGPDGVYDLEVGVHDHLQRRLRARGWRALGETPDERSGEARGGEATNGRHGLPPRENFRGIGRRGGGGRAAHPPADGQEKITRRFALSTRPMLSSQYTCAPIARPRGARDVHGALTRSTTSSRACGWPTASPSPTGSGSRAARAGSSPSSTAWPAT